MLNSFSRIILPVLILMVFVVGGCTQNSTNAAKPGEIVVEPGKSSSPLAKMADFGAVPDFSLKAQNGKEVTAATLKGKVWVADFFFTQCANACPMMNSNMEKLYKEFGNNGLKFLSISVDPEHDTAEHLAEYAKKFGAKEDEWLFLTGDKAKIIELSNKGFKLSATEEPSSHSQRLVLLDKEGHIRGYYRYDDEHEMAELHKNAELLLKN